MACLPHHVDVVTALDLLASCVRSFPPACELRGSGRRLLIEVALDELGVTFDQLSVAPIVAERRDVSEPGTSTATAFTIGAVVALRSTHRSELRGATWEQALSAARRNVIRLLDVVPQSVFEAASKGEDEAASRLRA